MADLKQFLIEMSKNTQLMKEFRTDPHASMTKAGLSHETIATVLSKNPVLINKAISGSTKGPGFTANANDIVVVLIL